MKRYNLHRIMTRAWRIFRKEKGLSFGEALHRSWLSAKAEPVNADRVQAAKELAGITEECMTWAGWKALGFEVVHGSKCLFQAVVVDAAKGDGKTKVKSYFGASQVQPITAA